MLLPYCPADGAGPRPLVDWPALYAGADDAATDALNSQRIAEPGHVARNGNPPRDGRCPECGAPVLSGEVSVESADRRATEIADAIALARALAELPDSPEGMADPVLLVGGPLADQVVDWPEPSVWQSVRSWVGAADTRSFTYGSQTVVYRRVGGAAGVA